MIDDKSPNCPAPAWKTVTHIVEMKIEEFSPNVPIKNSINKIARKSGRFQT